jgi:hypothetical protein
MMSVNLRRALCDPLGRGAMTPGSRALNPRRRYNFVNDIATEPE